MAAESQSLRCELCGESLDAPSRPCPHCGATPQWRDYLRAIGFAEAQFAASLHDGLIAPAQLEKFAKYLADLRENAKSSVRQGAPFRPDTGLPSASDCWRCGRAVRDCSSFCNTCGAPLGQEADTLRYLAYVAKLISAAAELELPAAQANACQAEVQARIASLRGELERGRLGPEAASDKARTTMVGQTPHVAARPHCRCGTPVVQPPRLPRRSFMQILLDPRSIQWLLASGGVLLVVGLVIWLASLGIFRNELVVAGCMGGATLALLAGGCGVVKYTRHQLAGKALTLLACLVMPLNLWFYQAHHLVTLDGHLWAAAMVCSVLYAAAAVVLEDPVFVYVLCGGVAMTGLLILGDLHKLYQIASPAALLVVLGLIALHAERAFAESDGPFSRKRFGMACFWSAQALIGAGLLLLLGADCRLDSVRDRVVRRKIVDHHRSQPAPPGDRPRAGRDVCLYLLRSGRPPRRRLCLSRRLHPALGRISGHRSGPALDSSAGSYRCFNGDITGSEPRALDCNAKGDRREILSPASSAAGAGNQPGAGSRSAGFSPAPAGHSRGRVQCLALFDHLDLRRLDGTDRRLLPNLLAFASASHAATGRDLCRRGSDRDADWRGWIVDDARRQDLARTVVRPDGAPPSLPADIPVLSRKARTAAADRRGARRNACPSSERRFRRAAFCGIRSTGHGFECQRDACAALR